MNEYKKHAAYNRDEESEEHAPPSQYVNNHLNEMRTKPRMCEDI